MTNSQDHQPDNDALVPASAVHKRRERFGKRIWRNIRGPIARSNWFKAILVNVLTAYFKLVYTTNPPVSGSVDKETVTKGLEPFIVTFWHGQHLMGPFVRPKSAETVAMFSRSRDAELNAQVAEKLGLKTVRGSGGRSAQARPDKGGARALLTLVKAMKQGYSTSIIADAHGVSREAGEGIILLAKLSGRPILPVAYAFSRRKVLEKSWDKTTIPLPFGRSAVVMGNPVWVGHEADEAQLELKRGELTRELNEATVKAYSMLEKVQ